MSYTKLMKKWEQESKQKEKEERIFRQKKKESDLIRSEELFMAQLKEENRQIELFQKEKQEKLKVKDALLLELRNNNPFTYPQYLIIWDLLTDNYIQIESDRNSSKISDSDIITVFQYVEKRASKLINEYWYNRLCLSAS